MVYVYLDESGDLGFNFERGSSRYLLIGLLITDRKYKADRCLKKIRRRKLKKTIKQMPEIKFNNSNRWLRRKVLHCIRDFDPDIAYIIMKKENVYEHLRSYPSSTRLYNYVATILLENVVPNYRGPIEIVIDKRDGSRYIQENFEDYIRDKLNYPSLRIVHKDSKEDRGLQAVDFICGAIFRYYNSNDDSYYSIIQDCLIAEIKLFPR